jgi:hypothetical protein
MEPPAGVAHSEPTLELDVGSTVDGDADVDRQLEPVDVLVQVLRIDGRVEREKSGVSVRPGAVCDVNVGGSQRALTTTSWRPQRVRAGKG